MKLNYRNNIDKKLNLINLKKCYQLISENKIKFIDNGLQGEVFKAQSEDCGSVVIKKRVMKEKHKIWTDNEIWIKKK